MTTQASGPPLDTQLRPVIALPFAMIGPEPCMSGFTALSTTWVSHTNSPVNAERAKTWASMLVSMMSWS